MPRQVDLAGVVAALSVTSDLTRGRPPGEAMRACLLATELARRTGLSPARQGEVFYASLMRYAGCAATSHEAAAAFGGDDIAVRSGGDLIDATRPLEALRFLGGLGSGVEKLRVLARAPQVPKIVEESARADCEVGADLTQRLRLPQAVGSPESAVAMVGRWSGRALDPSIAAVFLDAPAELLTLSNPDDVWAAVVDTEPQPRRFFTDDAHLDEALAGFGDAADLKSPFFQGHSRGVAALARAASSAVTGVDPTLVYRAGLVHDLGRVAVPTGIWERPGPLRPEEWELVRLHPYHSGRIVARSPLLQPLAEMVSRHHERVDGSGYPAGVRGSELDASARLLAAADAWRTLSETRPHREALTPAEAAQVISGMPLDRDVVRAVLRAADAPPTSFPRLPVDLTERELEVLRLLASGRTKRQIAAELFIAQSTVHTHTVHIYAKCDVSTRAGLAMFAMRHGLAANTA